MVQHLKIAHFCIDKIAPQRVSVAAGHPTLQLNLVEHPNLPRQTSRSRRRPLVPDRSPAAGPDDPIKSRSFAFPLLIASVLLMLTVAWSFYVEFYGLQPWRRYQSRFAEAYSGYLQKQVKVQKQNEDAVYASAGLQSSPGKS